MRLLVCIVCIFIVHHGFILKADSVLNKPNNALSHIELNERPRLDTLIFLDVTPCIGKCPSFSILFFSNSTVYLTARENFYLNGYFTHTLDNSKLKLLRKKLEEIDWQAVSPVYPENEIFLQGLPVHTLVFRDGEKLKKIRCQYDCPKEIIHIIDYLEMIIPNLEWVPVLM